MLRGHLAHTGDLLCRQTCQIPVTVIIQIQVLAINYRLKLDLLANQFLSQLLKCKSYTDLSQVTKASHGKLMKGCFSLNSNWIYTSHSLSPLTRTLVSAFLLLLLALARFACYFTCYLIQCKMATHFNQKRCFRQ